VRRSSAPEEDGVENDPSVNDPSEQADERPPPEGPSSAKESVSAEVVEQAAAQAMSREQALQNADTWVGRTLDGRYRLDSRLGAGGVGAVYRATQLNLGRSVAIKILLEGLHPSFRARFEREARALAGLRHPNIVAVSDFGVEKSDVEGKEQQTPFIVMELIEGETLHYRLAQGPLPAEKVMIVARELLRALSFVHDQGLVHRDLKPGNVLIEKLPHDEERVRLLDFGLAKAMEQGTGENVTRAGDVLGTPAYMAPEQVGGDKVDVRTDLYAFGVMLFQMLTGHVPFEGTPIDMLRSHIIAPPPALHDKRPAINAKPELEAVIAKALAKKREARFQTAAEFLRALEAIETPWLKESDPSTTEPKTTLQNTELADSSELPTKLHAPQSSGTPSQQTGGPDSDRARKVRSRRLGTIVGATIAAVALSLSISEDEPASTPGAEQAPAAAEPSDEDPPAQPAPVKSTSHKEQGATIELPAERAPTMELSEAEIAVLDPGEAASEGPRNPWSRPVPRDLVYGRKAAISGDRGSERLIGNLRRYNREHQEDPRGHLVLAQLYRNRKWREDMLGQYLIALQRDPRSRGAPEMLRDLLHLVGTGEPGGARAAETVRAAYGVEALPAIDNAIQNIPTDAAGRDRWIALRAAIAK
jgi:serine/threonine protein kinase